MPSVGMRRTTRVFGVVKGVDGARVLRSGRQIWPDSGDVNGRRPKDIDDWLSLIKTNKGDGGDLSHKINEWAYHTSHKQDDLPLEVPEVKHVEAVDSGDERSFDKMFGILYVRKRKRSAIGNSDFAATMESPNQYRMFGRQFVRRQRRKRGFENSARAQNVDSKGVFLSENMIRVVMESSQCRTHKGALFLYAVLMYLTKTRLRLAELSAFLFSEPINSVFNSSGIRVFGAPSKTTGSCQIFGATNFLPMFSLNFSAIPHCYMYMHSCILLKYKCQPLAFVDSSIDEHMRDVIMINVEENHCEGGITTVSLEKDILYKDPHTDQFENRQVQHPSVRFSKLAGGNTMCRNDSSSRNTQKKRRSSRRRKARNTSLIGIHKPNAPVGFGLMSFQRCAFSFSSIVSNTNSKTRGTFAGDLKEDSSTMVSSQLEIDISRCCSNVLVIESDKCFREEGANVLLELSPAGEWLLVVKKDGSTRFTHKAEKVMRLPSLNRITHATVWNIDNSWKLEFPSRQDWAIFKDLYRECSERNSPASSVKVIPVPGVCEVPCYGSGCSTPFIRSDSYISLNGDEVFRAMAKRNAIYDMDSDDEEWLLNKSNSSDLSTNEVHENVSEDNFELMIDAFEKAFYCNPSGSSVDEKSVVNLCQDLGRKEVVEAVYGYWMKKRKQRKAPLLRVFQGQVKKPPLIPKPHLRKKRSFKRQPSRLGRNKHLELLQEMATRQDALEEQKAELRLEEAKASAYRLTEIAISKRQRAQLLTENADLATYKATVVFRIAEAARVAESTDAAVAHFLD